METFIRVEVRGRRRQSVGNKKRDQKTLGKAVEEYWGQSVVTRIVAAKAISNCIDKHRTTNRSRSTSPLDDQTTHGLRRMLVAVHPPHRTLHVNTTWSTSSGNARRILSLPPPPVPDYPRTQALTDLLLPSNWIMPWGFWSGKSLFPVTVAACWRRNLV